MVRALERYRLPSCTPTVSTAPSSTPSKKTPSNLIVDDARGLCDVFKVYFRSPAKRTQRSELSTISVEESKMIEERSRRKKDMKGSGSENENEELFTNSSWERERNGITSRKGSNEENMNKKKREEEEEEENIKEESEETMRKGTRGRTSDRRGLEELVASFDDAVDGEFESK